MVISHGCFFQTRRLTVTDRRMLFIIVNTHSSLCFIADFCLVASMFAFTKVPQLLETLFPPLRPLSPAWTSVGLRFPRLAVESSATGRTDS